MEKNWKEEYLPRFIWDIERILKKYIWPKHRYWYEVDKLFHSKGIKDANNRDIASPEAQVKTYYGSVCDKIINSELSVNDKYDILMDIENIALFSTTLIDYALLEKDKEAWDARKKKHVEDVIRSHKD